MKTLKLTFVLSLFALMMVGTFMTSYGEESTNETCVTFAMEEVVDCEAEAMSTVVSENENLGCSPWQSYSYWEVSQNPCRNRCVYARTRACNGKTFHEVTGYGPWRPFC